MQSDWYWQLFCWKLSVLNSVGSFYLLLVHFHSAWKCVCIYMTLCYRNHVGANVWYSVCRNKLAPETSHQNVISCIRRRVISMILPMAGLYSCQENPKQNVQMYPTCNYVLISFFFSEMRYMWHPGPLNVSSENLNKSRHYSFIYTGRANLWKLCFKIVLANCSYTTYTNLRFYSCHSTSKV